MITSHILFLICVPMLVISVAYIFITQLVLVVRMAKKADLLETGKISLKDLSNDEILFIFTRYKIKLPK